VFGGLTVGVDRKGRMRRVAVARTGAWGRVWLGFRRVCGSSAVVLLLASLSAAPAAASGWSVQSTPDPAGARSSHLQSVSCPSSHVCFAVGYSATGNTAASQLPLAERWNGRKWSIQPTARAAYETSGALLGVSCTSSRLCTAVGEYYSQGQNELTLAERWNGVRWSVQQTQSPAGEMGIQFNGVSCSSRRACTSVGYYITSEGYSEALAERWNGRHWSLQRLPNRGLKTSGGLLGVSCTSSRSCSAVGSYYNPYTQYDNELTVAWRWNGARWELQPTPNPAGAVRSELDAVSCTSSRVCTAVGDSMTSTAYASPSAMLAERWNGVRWAIQTTATPRNAGQTPQGGVSCSGRRACTAVGSYDDQDKTLGVRWNGTRWSVQTTPDPGSGRNALTGVSCPSRRLCIAVGYHATEAGSEITESTLAERWRAA
jgi:hypothetical protein